MQRERWIYFEEMTTPDSPNWSAVYITEFLVILIINVITIIAFARIRHLRKRDTYLVINLTLADLLVRPLFLYHKDEESNSFTLPPLILWAIKINFLIASQVNLSMISLERLHVTLYPFRHCLITKWVYFKIIVGSRLIIFSVAFVITILSQDKFPYAWTSFNVLTLIVITLSYIIIIVNVQRSPHSQHHGSIHKEKKLSVTLFIVTGVSVLSILPWAILFLHVRR